MRHFHSISREHSCAYISTHSLHSQSRRTRRQTLPPPTVRPKTCIARNSITLRFVRIEYNTARIVLTDVSQLLCDRSANGANVSRCVIFRPHRLRFECELFGNECWRQPPRRWALIVVRCGEATKKSRRDCAAFAMMMMMITNNKIVYSHSHMGSEILSGNRGFGLSNLNTHMRCR